MKTEKQFGMDILIIEETINEDIFEIPEVEISIIENFKKYLAKGE